MENVSSAQLSKKMDPEEYDLVILGGGTGSTIAAWTFAKHSASQRSTANMSADRARTLPVSLARTLFTVRRLHRIFAEATSSA
jgi:hypothetical protein